MRQRDPDDGLLFAIGVLALWVAVTGACLSSLVFAARCAWIAGSP